MTNSLIEIFSLDIVNENISECLTIIKIHENKGDGEMNIFDNMSEYYSPKSFNSHPAQIKNTGYCIRLGIEIPFNPKKPFSSTTFQKWAQYKDENYCHKTGKRSNGKNFNGQTSSL